MADLNGRVVVVTGAAGGIGRATAARLAADGASVVLADRAEAALRAVTTEVAAVGRCLPVTVDLSTEDGNRELVERAVAEYGGIDAFHANAAIQRMGRIDTTATEDWVALFETNLLGAALGIKHAVPVMAARGGGSVVITSSLLGIVGDIGMPAYGAMKGGLRALCKSLAAAHGPDGIRVNTICPGDVRTPMLDDFFANQPDPQSARTDILQHYPLGRFAEPEDIAALVRFLVSDDAAYISGIDVPIDGGLLAKIY